MRATALCKNLSGYRELLLIIKFNFQITLLTAFAQFRFYKNKLCSLKANFLRMDNFVNVFNRNSLPTTQSRVFYFMADVCIFKLMIEGILSMTGVKYLHLKISQNTKSCLA